FILRDEDGGLLYSNDYRKRDSEGWKAMFEAYSGELNQTIYEFDMRMRPLAMRLTDTPGYEVWPILYEDYREYIDDDDKEMILEVVNPYGSYRSFSDCVQVTIGLGFPGITRQSMEAQNATWVLIALCVLGIVLFPLVSFIFGKLQTRYMTFGFFCFFWSVYSSLSVNSWYLNSYAYDPVICMTLHRGSVFLFFTALLVYFRANLQKDISRIIAAVLEIIFMLATAAAFVLHFAGICDLVRFSSFAMWLMAAFMAILAVLLSIEAKKDKNAFTYLISWVPMMATLLLDIADHFISIPGDGFTKYGFSVTLILQIVRLLIDLRHQYKEAIRYQQMQKELYEAKVSVMTSQIQPHFMYNALTSIAMMCTIDPGTAQEATITFAKYLRTNMDSLRQRAPVKFEAELEHLKKYLYIEKLRFQDKLNIEYNITVTDFLIPQLSVQPIVENAVKHGVGMKKKGGTVTIATRETDNDYEVIISDDGVGFDVTAARKDDERSHIGMENTVTRLREMCSGRLNIESSVGEGTTVTIILPKEGQKNEDTVS
ncbi:MAG: histidine kinase, partial [Oscillospiraceae bacterium]|nr:histidine kinase [Oscillospiraceae bacterium]